MGTTVCWRASFVLCAACLCPPTTQAQATGVKVDCDAGNTIQEGLSHLKPGDTLLVSGTCRESVAISAEAVRITLNGQNKATIQHPGGAALAGPGRHAVYIRGKAITITGFTIRGGQDGIHLSGPAHAVIDGNAIIQNRGRGIHLDKASVAQIVANRITDNGGTGIHVTEKSYARIGFLIPPDEHLRPNTIEGNGGGGISVERGSSAWIVGNTIRGNTGTGVALDRNSDADAVANAIDGNSGDGISATRNSGVNLRSEGTARAEGPNRTDSAQKNDGVGLRCSIGGYVDGPLGTLTGNQGPKELDRTCVDHLTAR
jgi:nitrous oxidase accessory protein NosD